VDPVGRRNRRSHRRLQGPDRRVRRRQSRPAHNLGHVSVRGRSRGCRFGHRSRRGQHGRLIRKQPRLRDGRPRGLRGRTQSRAR
jgi:hypothetical protein